MARMCKRHLTMFQRIMAMLKVERDYASIDEIRILNDGGGTGTWHVSLKINGKVIRGANIPMKAIFAQPEIVPPDEYYDCSHDKKEYC